MTLRSVTAHAWYDALTTIWLSSAYFTIFGGAVELLDYAAAGVLLAGLVLTAVALVGTLVLGVRALWQAP